MEFVNNNICLLLVATSHRNITSISNTLVLSWDTDGFVEKKVTHLEVSFTISTRVQFHNAFWREFRILGSEISRATQAAKNNMTDEGK